MSREEADLIFERVAEWDVGDVVQQSREPHHDVRSHAQTDGVTWICVDRLDHTFRDRECSKAVVEASVCRASEDLISPTELSNPTEALKIGGVHDFRLQPGQLHVSLDRIEKSLVRPEPWVDSPRAFIKVARPREDHRHPRHRIDRAVGWATGEDFHERWGLIITDG